MRFTKKIEKEMLYEIILFFIFGNSVTFLYENNFLLTMVLLIEYSTAMMIWYNKHDTYLFIVAAILGSFGEITAVSAGVWSYSYPYFLGIPLWLPFLWGAVAVLMKRSATTFEKLIK